MQKRPTSRTRGGALPFRSPLIHTQPMSDRVGVRSLTVGVGAVLAGALVFAVFGPRGEVKPIVAPMEQMCADAAISELGGGEPSGEYRSTLAEDSDWKIRTSVKTDRWHEVTCTVRLPEGKVVRLSTR